MAQWGALPTRQPGEVISQLDYRVETSPAGPRHVTTFRHRDNRVWQARIINEPQTVGQHTYPWMSEVSCAGCRSWVFLSMSLDQSKRTLSRFANLSLAMYERLVADASGTTDKPIPGVVGVFRMRIPQLGNRSATDPTHTEITGVARYDGGQIVVFPTSPEFTSILSSVCASDTIALVPTGINEVPSEDTPVGGFMLGRHRHAYNSLAAPELSEAELNEALGRLRDGTAERVMSGLRAGDYTTTRHREEREIDFGDEEAS